MKGTAHRASTAHPAITFIGRLALAALILVVLVEVYFLARGFNLYREAIEEAGLDEMAASIQSSESFTPIDELPDLYLQAVVAVEDHRFYAHPGFDAIATARALMNDLKAGAIVEGGSTITQQLAKNQYFTQEQTVERKIAEVFMALTMEQHFSKRTILELYVNSIYFGDGYEGIGSASWGYFGKAPQRARCRRMHAAGRHPERAERVRAVSEPWPRARAPAGSVAEARVLRLPRAGRSTAHSGKPARAGRMTRRPIDPLAPNTASERCTPCMQVL